MGKDGDPIRPRPRCPRLRCRLHLRWAQLLYARRLRPTPTDNLENNYSCPRNSSLWKRRDGHDLLQSRHSEPSPDGPCLAGCANRSGTCGLRPEDDRRHQDVGGSHSGSIHGSGDDNTGPVARECVGDRGTVEGAARAPSRCRSRCEDAYVRRRWSRWSVAVVLLRTLSTASIEHTRNPHLLVSKAAARPPGGLTHASLQGLVSFKSCCVSWQC